MAILHRAYAVDLETVGRDLSSLATHEDLIAHAKQVEARWGLAGMSLRIDLRIDEENPIEQEGSDPLGILMVMTGAARRIPSWSELKGDGWGFLHAAAHRSGLADSYTVMVRGRPLRELATYLPGRWSDRLAGPRYEHGGWLDAETAGAFRDLVAGWERDTELIADLVADERHWQDPHGRNVSSVEAREEFVRRILKTGASMYSAVGSTEALWMFLD